MVPVNTPGWYYIMPEENTKMILCSVPAFELFFCTTYIAFY